MAPRLHLEHYLAGIIDNDGADVQAMWSNGRNAETAALGHDDGAAVAQAVGRGARRSGDDQTIGLIIDQEITINIGTYGNHGSRISLQHSYVIKRKRIVLKRLTIRRSEEHTSELQ